MTFPSSPPPSWFCSGLNLSNVTNVVVVDDDTVIHDVWRKRFETLSTSNSIKANISNFSAMETFVNRHKDYAPVDCLFLVDYEFLGHSKTGLALIEELGIAKASVLVTSRYDELKVRKQCQRLGVQVIPKGMAPFVPITI